MSKDKEHIKLVPELRFPEFENDGEWTSKRLDSVSKIDRGKSKHRPRNAEFLYGGKYPFVQTGDIKATQLYLTQYSQTYSEEGLKQSKLWDVNTLCITIAANIAETAILKIKACFPDSIIGLIPNKNETTVLFVKYLFDKFKLEIKQLSQGIAQDNLNKEKLSSLQFSFPSFTEQQKIAATFTTLDTLIAAENEKLEALQAHKKGLLQQLFPAKGEKVPKLRFGEFSGDWEIRSIERNIDLISGIALKSKDLTTNKTGTPILRGINITEGRIRHSDEMDKFYLGDISEMDKYLVEENDIVIGMDGSKVGKNVSLVSKQDAGSILIQRVARIRAVGSNFDFLYQHFVSSGFRKYVDMVNTSSGIPHISVKQIRDYEIGFPPTIKEQDKIANCLSSLDDLIAFLSEKIVALKEHKIGLMQQLFPSKND